MKKKFKIPEWKDRYSIGIPDIDNQHKYFLNLIRTVSVLSKNKPNHKLVKCHLDEVLYYARYHFLSEENLMKLWNYPEIDNMNKLHNILITKLADMITLYEMGKNDIDETITFLISWFVDHTVKEDRKIAVYIENNPESNILT